MIDVRPWTPCPPADDRKHVRSAWLLADAGAQQHPLQVRAIYDAGELVVFGGVVQMVPEDGLAFLWRREGLSRYAWRRILPVCGQVLWNAHERGMRRISAVVAASSPPAVRFIKALGFSFAGVETGFAGTTEPMLRYVRCWPGFAEPVLVSHQLHELERACHALWCPELTP